MTTAKSPDKHGEEPENAWFRPMFYSKNNCLYGYGETKEYF